MERNKLKNDIRIIGEVLNKEVERKNVGKDDESIRVDLKVKSGDVDEHEVSFFAYKYTKDKDKGRTKANPVSQLFTGYETIAKEYKFIADDSEGADGTGEKVDIKGELNKNMYVGTKDGKLKEPVKLRGKFCERVTDMTKYKPCAVWSVHMHITKIEDVEGDVTGDFTKVIGMVLGYQVEDEIEFRIYREKVRKGFDKVFDEGDSALFKGNIVNRPDEAESTEEDEDDCGWGDEMDVEADTSTIRRRYFEILKGDPKPMSIDEDDEKDPLSLVNIKQYKKNIAKRKSDKIAEYEKKQKEDKGMKGIDPNTGTSNNNNVEDDDEIPF